MNKSRNRAIVIIIIIVVLIIVFFASQKSEKRKEKVKEDEQRIKELEKLTTKKEIAEKHAQRNQWIQGYLEEEANKWYKWLLRGLIIAFVLLNILIYFLVPKMNLGTILQLNETLVFGITILEFLIYFKIKGAHVRIKEGIKEFVEYRTFKKRDKDYFLNKAKKNEETIQETSWKIKSIEDKGLRPQ